MPAFDDYDKSEDQQGAGGGGLGGGSSGGGGAVLSQATPQKETGFVPWERFVNANKDVAARGANALNNQVGNEVTGFKNQLGQDQKDYQKGIESQYDHSGGPQGPGVGQFTRSPAGGAAPQGAPSGFAAPAVSEKAQEANPGKGAAIGQAPPGQRTLGGGAQATGFQPLGAGTLFQGGSGAGLALNQSYSRTGPSAQAVANGPQGGKDLESSLGADAWGRLLGQGQKAQDDAAALGSQSGVQGLIQQQAGQPLAQNGAFDAALEYGQGQKQFGQTAKAGQGLVNQLAGANQTAQGQWSKLMSDVTTARQQANQAQSNASPGASGAANGAGAGGKTQAQLDADLQTARMSVGNGIAAYSDGMPGGVNSLGDKAMYLTALTGGKEHGDNINWDNTPSVQQQTDAACKALGISQDEFIADVRKMTDQEYQNFWLLGVIPTWMQLGQGSQTYGQGVPGGWQSPYVQQVTGYGQDGGMWNAITNMWKDGVTTVAESAAGGPSGAVKGAVKGATYRGPGGGKK